ncbi:MAG: hypothetical protein AAFQ52_04810, partial [Chloroflexota bacterium]
MMGMDGGRRLFDREVVKPQDLSSTLKRFAKYFRPYWWVIMMTLVLIMVSTWTQILAPQIIGQAVDCYLFDSQAFGGASQLLGESDAPAQNSNCWFTDRSSAVIEAEVFADESIAEADKQSAINQQKIAGLGTMVLALLGLYLLGAVMQGGAFFSMA